MKPRWLALGRPFLYAFLVLLIGGSAALMLSPAWFRESLMRLQFPVTIQASSLRFVSQTTPEKEIDRLKSVWPAHFDAGAYDQPDDELAEAVSNSQMVVVLDFPDRGGWPSSALHELKRFLKVAPFTEGKWFVTAMGQKMVFVPDAESGKIWEPGESYKVYLPETVRVKAQKRWYEFEPFKLAFSVPACEVKISHSIEVSESAPLRYQAVFHFWSPYPISIAKIRERISLTRIDKGVEQARIVATEIQSGQGRHEVEIRSGLLEPKNLNELVASLPSGDYMEAIVCQSQPQVERVPASAFNAKLTVLKASIDLDQPDASFWPEPVLSLTFSQPVAQVDVIEHLRVNGTQTWSLKPHPISAGSAREFLFTIEMDHYEESQVELHFTPGPWTQSGIESPELAGYDKKLSMTKPDSLCPRSTAAIFDLKSEPQHLLACGSLEANRFLVTGLNVWKFESKKDSPAIRLIGETSEGEDGVSSSVVCFNADRSRIFISAIRAEEKFGEEEVPPFRGRGERAGFACDASKMECLAENFDLESTCVHPLSGE